MMSVKYMALVWELALPREEKFVALAVADHSDDRGVCFPSVARIAWKCGYSERQTQAILKKLRQRQILAVLGNSRGGRGRATLYRVQPEMGAKSAPFSKRCKTGAEWAKAELLKDATATAPQPSVTVSLQENHHRPKCGRGGSGATYRMMEPSLVERLNKYFPQADRALVDWAVERIAGRATTPPRSLAFYVKSLRLLFENLSAERDLFLNAQARVMFAAGVGVGDISERLKVLAGRNSLPYDATVIDRAVATAEVALRRERELETGLHAGAGPVRQW